MITIVTESERDKMFGSTSCFCRLARSSGFSVMPIFSRIESMIFEMSTKDLDDSEKTKSARVGFKTVEKGRAKTML
jgi:hypothetical protein